MPEVPWERVELSLAQIVESRYHLRWFQGQLFWYWFRHNLVIVAPSQGEGQTFTKCNMEVIAEAQNMVELIFDSYSTLISQLWHLWTGRVFQIDCVIKYDVYVIA